MNTVSTDDCGTDCCGTTTVMTSGDCASVGVATSTGTAVPCVTPTPVGKLVVEELTRIDDDLRDRIIRLWMSVNDTGGGVGFAAGATYAEVAEGLAKHEASMHDDKGWLYIVREPETGELLAFAWWIIALSPTAPHIGTIKRLMVRGDQRGTGVGKLMMDHLHSPAVLAGLRVHGVDFLHLQYRAGRGLGGWYARYGYEHIARFDLFRLITPGEYGGWNEMLRTIDGGPLPEISL